MNDWIESESYADLRKQTLPRNGLVAYYDFEKKSLSNTLNSKDLAYTTLAGNVREKEVWTAGREGAGLQLNGDAWLDLGQVGIFRKAEPFTVGLWVTIPKEMQEGVIFHKSQAERLYNFRGYHVYLKDGKLEMSMAHVAPSNAITKISRHIVPRDQWIQLTMTYDGSAKAAGLKLYQNGKEMAMTTTMDHLEKDIIFDERRVSPQPGLQIGGWWRGYGFKDGLIDDIVVYNRTLTPYEVAIVAQKASWQTIAAKSSSQLTEPERAALRGYFFSTVHAPTQAARKQVVQARTALADSTEPIQELMIMREAACYQSSPSAGSGKL